MATILFAVDNGYLNDVPVNRIAIFEQALLAYVQARHKEFIEQINQSGIYNDEIAGTLRTIIESFKANQSWE
jgi:F-type H+-transporting ATPase subunit alpha